jgi:hypothetical protein
VLKKLIQNDSQGRLTQRQRANWERARAGPPLSRSPPASAACSCCFSLNKNLHIITGLHNVRAYGRYSIVHTRLSAVSSLRKMGWNPHTLCPGSKLCTNASIKVTHANHFKNFPGDNILKPSLNNGGEIRSGGVWRVGRKKRKRKPRCYKVPRAPFINHQRVSLR